MKTFLLSLITVVALFAFTMSGGIGEVISALKAGNASQMSKYFDNTVDITISGKSSSYGKNQAELILKDFFANNPVKSFTIIHQGDNAGSQYCIGTLVTKNGSFRTTIYMKEKAGNQTLQEIRFES